MSKLKKLLPIILIVIAAALAGFFLLGDSGTFTGSLTEALSSGKELKCAWEDDFGGSGTIYIRSEDEIYSEINGSDGSVGYLLVTGSCLYGWGEGDYPGAKLCSTPAEGEGDTSFLDLSNEADVSLEDGLEYNCVKESAADALFAPPAGVDFTEWD